jgi:hypothetical protein
VATVVAGVEGTEVVVGGQEEGGVEGVVGDSKMLGVLSKVQAGHYKEGMW